MNKIYDQHDDAPPLVAYPTVGMSSQPKELIRTEHLCQRFGDVTIFSDICLTLHAGESVALLGASGSGKSSLLHLLGGLDEPFSGMVYWSGRPIFSLGQTERGFLRNTHMGFVYQFHHLLPEFSAWENIVMPLRIHHSLTSEDWQKAADLARCLGLDQRLEQRPAQLSGGERQRVALARALITNPKCLLADEPTGNLDSDNAEHVMNLLLSLCQERHMALLLVTHDHALAKQTQRRYQFKRGQLCDVHS